MNSMNATKALLEKSKLAHQENLMKGYVREKNYEPKDRDRKKSTGYLYK